MTNIRFWFKKQGRLKFISHLDVNRTVFRCIRLAGLPVAFSSGFNPRPALTFALPLSLGVESECEVMDMKMTQDIDPAQAVEMLNKALPAEMQVFKAAAVATDPKHITRAGYSLKLYGQPPAEIAQAFETYWNQPQIPVIKKNKSGEREVDLKTCIHIINTQVEADAFVVALTLPAGVTENINPSLLVDHFIEGKNLYCSITRTGIFLADGKEFF